MTTPHAHSFLRDHGHHDHGGCGCSSSAPSASSSAGAATISTCCKDNPAPDVATLLTWPRPALVKRYRKGVEHFDRRLFSLTEEQMDMAFLPDAGVGTWPVRVLLGHLADAELLFIHRMRRAFAEQNPVLSVWDEQAAIDSGIYGNGAMPPASTPEASKARVHHALGGFVAVIHTLRQWGAAWLATLSDEDFAKKAMHPERGEQTIKTIAAYNTWHLEHHARFLNAKMERLLGPRPEEEMTGGCCGGGGGGCGCKGG